MTVLLSFIIGLIIGFHYRQIRNKLEVIIKLQKLKAEVQESRVVVPQQPTSGSVKVDKQGRIIQSRVIHPKTPAEVQVDRDNEFSRKVS